MDAETVRKVTCRFCRREVFVGVVGLLILHPPHPVAALAGEIYCPGTGLTVGEAAL